jgi:hypothetical protein
MRRIFKLSMAGFAAALASACSGPEQVTQSPAAPSAGVRFINAVTDTGGATGLDFRFVDKVENNAQPGILVRNSPVSGDTPTWIGSTKLEYKNAAAGARYFKIFLSDTNQTVASTVLNKGGVATTNTVLSNDTTLNLVAGKNYTVIMYGEARTGSANGLHLMAFEEAQGDPGVGKAAIRIINMTPTTINATANATTGGALLGTFAGVTAYSVSAYNVIDTTTVTYNVTGAGITGTLSGVAMLGIPNTVDQPAVPGTRIAGSAVTGIVWPRTVAGAATVPQTAAFNAPLMSFIWDRRPPKGCSDVLC